MTPEDNFDENFDPTNVRDLTTGGRRIGPLRQFTAILAEAPWEKRVGRQSGKSYVVVKLLLTDMDVAVSTEPFLMPSHEIELFYNNNEGSEYGIFGVTVGQCLDMALTEDQKTKGHVDYIPPAKRVNLKDVYGRRFGFVLDDGEDGRPEMHPICDGRKKEEVPQRAWEVYSIEGYGTRTWDVGDGTAAPMEGTAAPATTAPTKPSNATQAAMDALDGKNQAAFNIEAMGNDVVKADVGVLTSIADGSFLETMVSTGQFTQDSDGAYHRVVTE